MALFGAFKKKKEEKEIRNTLSTGLELIKQEKWEDAISVLWQLANDGNLTALFSCAMAFEALEKYEDAKVCASMVLEHGEADEEVKKKADVIFKKAEEKINEARNQEEHCRMADLIEAGAQAVQKQQYMIAVEILNEPTEKGYYEAVYATAFSLYKLGFFEEDFWVSAESLLNFYLSKNLPENYTASLSEVKDAICKAKEQRTAMKGEEEYQAGLTALKAKDFDTAIDYFMKGAALAHARSNAKAAELFTVLYDQTHDEEYIETALKLAQRACLASAGIWDVTHIIEWHIGKSKEREGKIDEAIDYYTKSADRGFAEAAVHLAKLYAPNKETREQAEEWLSKATRLGCGMAVRLRIASMIVNAEKQK